MIGKRDLRWFGGVSAALVATSFAGAAGASTGIDSPENGVVQVGRGSAWVAKADDPLAAYFNPAGLVRQSSGVHVGAHIMLMHRCFTRQGPGGVPVSPGADLPGPGDPGSPDSPAVGPNAEVCKEQKPFPNPQLAVALRLTPQFALGFSVLGPHGVGKSEWPESVPFTNRLKVEATQPAPQRYMLITADSSILLPTISASYAVSDSLSFGAGFTWGLGIVQFVNFTEGLSAAEGEPPTDDFVGRSDIKATLSAADLFIPGFVVGALWSPTRNFDVAGWFTWKDALRSKADLRAEPNYWKASGLKNDNLPPCPADDPGCNVTDTTDPKDPAFGKQGDLVFRIPMEAKIGMRFHYPHPLKTGKLVQRPTWADKPGMIVHDSMSQDLFDVELDFTWAHNSVLEDLELSFPAGIAVEPGEAPKDSSVPHHWKDVVGVRLGGDYMVLPNLLAVRGGAFYESKGQDDEYLNIDFHLGWRVGLSAGATVRFWRIDLSAAYQHTFFGTLDNGGNGALKAISGDKHSGFRSRQSINGGKLTTSLNEFGLAATLRY